ncbi:MAG TPA: HlyD family secretion protein [Cyanobacteria bacterium UBA11049]|nr:HlyD family secretion protein [Cyanobacteria bacterium UBA11049]
MSIISERENFRLKKEQDSRPKGRWKLAVAIAALLGLGGVAFNHIQQAQKQKQAQVKAQNIKPVVANVTALGRLEPRGEVLKLSAPSSPTGTRVDQILVGEGKRVRVGDVVAILDNRDRAQAALEKAKAQLKVSQANVANVQAGAKTGEIEAQKATIARLQAELQGQKQTLQATVARIEAEQRNAAVDFQRYEKLYQDGAISAQQLDSRRLSATTSSEQLNESEATRHQTIAMLEKQIDEAKATLNKIEEVRPTDVRLAQAEVGRAIGEVKQAQADLALALVKAPISGEIIKIHTRAGEAISADGIAEMGRTEQMIAVAEVLESDIGRVRLGQRATISSENQAFSGQIQGTVIEVGRQIGKQDVLDSDPAADVDARVVEVKIGLSPEASQRVSGLTYANVVVKILI